MYSGVTCKEKHTQMMWGFSWSPLRIGLLLVTPVVHEQHHRVSICERMLCNDCIITQVVTILFPEAKFPDKSIMTRLLQPVTTTLERIQHLVWLCRELSGWEYIYIFMILDAMETTCVSLAGDDIASNHLDKLPQNRRGYHVLMWTRVNPIGSR